MIINCVAYQNGRKLADIRVSEISSYIARPDCFVWVGLKDPEPAELKAMQHEFGLHELAVEDAHHGHQRPKIDEYDGSLFVVLHLIELKNDELNVGEMAIFAGPKYVLSVRARAEQGFADVRARCEQEPELLRHGAGYVLYALMDAVVDRYFPVLDSIESAIEDIEERIFADQPMREHIEALYSAKRKLMILKHATEPLLEATAKLHDVYQGEGYFERVLLPGYRALTPELSIDLPLETLATWEMPVCIIHGEEDEIFPVAIAKQMCATLPNCELHVFPRQGHSLIFRQSRKVGAILQAFLEKHEKS